MYKFSIFLLLIVLVFSCNNYEVKRSKLLIISGKVVDFNESTNLQTLKFHFKNPFGLPVEQKVYLNDSGEFKLELKQLYSQSVYMNQAFSFYVNPGDSIYLEIDRKLLDDSLFNRSHIFNYVKVTGDSEEMNQNFLSYRKFLEDSIYDWEKERESFTSLNYQEFRKYITERTKVREKKVNSFIISINACNQFREYAENSVRFGALDDLMRYKYLHCTYNKIRYDSLDLPMEYYSFLKMRDFNNKELMKSNEFLSFLHYYSMFFNFDALNEISQETLKAYHKNEDKLAAYKFQINNIKKNTSGFLKDVFLTSLFYKFLDWNDLDLFEQLYCSSLIENKDFNELLIVRYESIANKLRDPEFYTDKILKDLSISDNNILQSLIKKYPNKVLYIDFWAPWCGPCIGEIESANKLHDKYIDKEIVFVYLANRCSEKSWEITISEKNIKGKHILLDNKEFNQLSDKFNISGIPHYLMIDRKGLIVNDNAPRPSDVVGISNLIDSLLKN